MQQGFTKIARWDDIKGNIPKKLKISPLAMIPHKSQKFRAILDLLFEPRLMGGHTAPSVNESTMLQAPPEAMDQLGSVLPRLIEAVAKAPDDDGPILFAKLDIKDGFWRMVVPEEEEWNFACVLPNLQEGAPVELVIPSALQMGWCESPPFFCAASETARNVAEELIAEPTGSLPPHPLEEFMMPPSPTSWPETNLAERCEDFLTMIEVHVDAFLALCQCQDLDELRHISRAVMHAVHDVFPPPAATGHSGGDSISEKKLQQGEGLWEF